jgi:hypothetical protein
MEAFVFLGLTFNVGREKSKNDLWDNPYMSWLPVFFASEGVRAEEMTALFDITRLFLFSLI